MDVTVYEPGGRPARRSKVDRSSNVPRMTAGRAALVGLMDRYLGALMDPSITLLEVHKLMYLLQEAGQPLRCATSRDPMGRMPRICGTCFTQLKGHLISGYADGGDRPDKQLSLVPGSMDDATEFLSEDPTTQVASTELLDWLKGSRHPSVWSFSPPPSGSLRKSTSTGTNNSSTRCTRGRLGSASSQFVRLSWQRKDCVFRGGSIRFRRRLADAR